MRLEVYGSTPRATQPNLIALQDEALSALPTVLVCPLKGDVALTGARVELLWEGRKLVACTDLIRPIRRTALRPMGALDEATSRRVIERFLKLLAR